MWFENRPLFFPDDVSTQKQIEDRLKALEAENAQLRNDVQALSQSATSTPSGNSPGPDVFLVLALVGLTAFLVTRRRTT